MTCLDDLARLDDRRIALATASFESMTTVARRLSPASARLIWVTSARVTTAPATTSWAVP